jgi:hypothetical protein
VHNGIFLNNCRLLLRLVEDDKVTEDMLEDTDDRRWSSKELNERLETVLNDSFETCRSIIEETKDVIGEMRKELENFDVLRTSKKKVCVLVRSTLTYGLTHPPSAGRDNQNRHQTTTGSGSYHIQQNKV